MYKTDALASSWDTPKTRLRREDEWKDITKGMRLVYFENRIPQNQESKSVLAVPDNLPESLSEIPPEMPPDTVSGTSVVMSPQYHVRFIFLPFILLTFPFLPPYMSFGSQAAGDVVVLKFDMHVYTSVLTSDEVKNLAEEYAIPSDLHPCVPPSFLTMNRPPVDKIGVYDQYLELS
ncbi:hypothetical protein Tco_1074207, partial [Tanacetum coccineum]